MERRHHVFWAEFFGIDPGEFETAGVSVVPHVGLIGYGGTWFFMRGARLVVSTPEAWLPHLRHELVDADPVLPSPAAVSRLFGAELQRSVGPAFHGALTAAAFRPSHTVGVRPIGESDAEALLQFRAECALEQWNDAALDDATLFRAAHFQDDRITALAGFRPWSQTAGDPCVLTHPDYRGRGLAKRVVSAVVAEALAAERVLLYQTLESNPAAVRLALGLGYSRYANHLAVRLSSERP